MGKAKGKGKKQTAIASNEDTGSSKEEISVAQKKRGRPTKPLKDENGEQESAEIVEDGEDVKDSTVSKDVKSPSSTENGRKKKKPAHTKESTETVKEENGIATKLSTDNSTMSTGFRHIGSRRKNKPRRAAEAVIECN